MNSATEATAIAGDGLRTRRAESRRTDWGLRMWCASIRRFRSTEAEHGPAREVAAIPGGLCPAYMRRGVVSHAAGRGACQARGVVRVRRGAWCVRSEEHTSELQSHSELV